MNTTVLKLSESDAFLRNISIRTIKDVRALDVDLLLILTNGDRIVISSGAMQALNAPDMTLQFSDGQSRPRERCRSRPQHRPAHAAGRQRAGQHAHQTGRHRHGLQHRTGSR